ncbi:MAG: hypothetical protein M3Y57_05505 [Acidobacteriota bacterium]|nr:hypothetical protein [Acidobacteriota bacterium]
MSQRDQPFRLRIGQWFQEHAIDDAEDGGVYAGSGGDGDDGEGSETGAALRLRINCFGRIENISFQYRNTNQTRSSSEKIRRA